MGNWRGRKT